MNALEFLLHPYALAIYGAIVLWQVWRLLKPKPRHKDYYERFAESYDNIGRAYANICAQGFVSDDALEKIRQADWLAKHFLPKEIRVFTQQWLKKTTDANLLHKNIGKFGHLDPGGTASQKAENADAIFSIENKNDEAEIIAWLKAHDPKQAYKKHLPSL